MGSDAAKDLKRSIGVSSRACLRTNGAKQRTVVTNHKRPTLARQWTHAVCTELFVDRAVCVRKQWIVESVLQLELCLQFQRICADSHSLSPEFDELGTKVAEMTAFTRSKRGSGFRVEEQDHGPASEKLIERHCVPGLVRGCEVFYQLAIAHGPTLDRSTPMRAARRYRN